MNISFKKQNGNFYEDRASLLKCMGDPNSLKIIGVLAKEKDPCVSDITKKLEISISAVSHQLSKLKAMGIVKTKRTGQTICYSLSNSNNAKFAEKLIDRRLSF
jgi:DNA-binding transcriptional ArsR family regulator